MGHTLHAVLDEELVGVAVLAHVEVAGMHLSDNVSDIAALVELGALLEFEDGLLQVVIGREHRHYHQRSALLNGLRQLLLTELEDLLNVFRCHKFEIITDVSRGLE